MNSLPEDKKPVDDTAPDTHVHFFARSLLFCREVLARPFLWTLKPWARKAALPFLGVLTLCLVGFELFFPFHGHTPFSGIKGFYALFGFIGFGLIVLSGWPLRVLLSRKPDYYEESDDGA